MPAFLTGCAADQETVSDAPPSTEDEVKNGLRLEQLPASSALRKKVDEQSSTWRDENTMNGGVDVMARKVAPAALANLGNVAKAALTDRMNADNVKVTGGITASKGPDKAVAEAAKVVAADGFFLSNTRENVAPVEAAVTKLVAALGSPAELDVSVAKAKVKTSFDPEGAPVRVTVFVFANKKTGELVVFYAREATG